MPKGVAGSSLSTTSGVPDRPHADYVSGLASSVGGLGVSLLPRSGQRTQLPLPGSFDGAVLTLSPEQVVAGVQDPIVGGSRSRRITAVPSGVPLLVRADRGRQRHEHSILTDSLDESG
jgi:hypothetical protein